MMKSEGTRGVGPGDVKPQLTNGCVLPSPLMWGDQDGATNQGVRPIQRVNKTLGMVRVWRDELYSEKRKGEWIDLWGMLWGEL